jgi:SAM-dependent methyltransferase
VQQPEYSFERGSFDAIVCGDILEHLRDPGSLLRRAATWLRPDGCIVASIPNVRHHSVVRALLQGNWTYESAGLLDRDHVRFFTRREIEKLFYRAGFEIRALSVVPGPGYDEWVQQGRPTSVQIAGLHVAGMTAADAEEIYTYQYLVSAVRAARPSTGLQPSSSSRTISSNTRGSMWTASVSGPMNRMN